LNTKEVLERTLAIILTWSEHLIAHLDDFQDDLDGQRTAVRTKQTAIGVERWAAFLAVVSDAKCFWGTTKSQTKDAARILASKLKEDNTFWSAVNAGSTII